MPTMAEAETELENDGVELTAANRKAWTNFSNYIEEYWDPRWVEAHGMTEEEVEQRSEETHRRVEEYHKDTPVHTAVGKNRMPSPPLTSRIRSKAATRPMAVMRRNTFQQRISAYLCCGSCGFS